MKPTVDQGVIPVNAIALVRAECGVRVYMADLKSKRAVIFGLGTDEEDDGLQSLMVQLDRDEDTLHVDPAPENELTTIRFGGLARDWKMRATVGRYTLYIFLWQDSTEQFHEVWASED